MKIEDLKARLAKVFRLNATAEAVRRPIPRHQHPEIANITRGLPRGGPHNDNKKGAGLDYFDQRPFQPGQDDPRGINAKYSQKRGENIYVVRQAEIRHNFYFWRSNQPSMDWKSEKAPYTPREAAEIITFAFAQQVTGANEYVGLLESGDTWRGQDTSALLGMQMARETGAHDMPRIQNMPARQSSAVLISDFLPGDATIDKLYTDMERTLQLLRGESVSGWVIMVADPETVDFTYKDIELFKGLQDASLEVSLGKGKRKEQQAEYKNIAAQHINRLSRIAEAYGFKFILQRTDQPLQQSLRTIYGMQRATPLPQARKEVTP